MFAMTSLVGTRVVAAPKATRAVRSTKTVAAFGAKKAPAKKAPAKKKVDPAVEAYKAKVRAAASVKVMA